MLMRRPPEHVVRGCANLFGMGDGSRCTPQSVVSVRCDIVIFGDCGTGRVSARAVPHALLVGMR